MSAASRFVSTLFPHCSIYVSSILIRLERQASRRICGSLRAAPRFVKSMWHYAQVRAPRHHGSHLLPGNVMLLAPVDCYLSKGFRTECIPSLFDVVPPNGRLKAPECAGAVDGV